ncbi:hypothetical protein H0264_35975 [Nocardia huaxiensis]|uniref:Mce-associated membrane protein n=1 Tax=Nocardia huaxiensis TaxID=2755382 RepID=A0A7D6VGC3_9NOCA|nr:hypothetical protein H0264_35975 [Nocardia huaxiensis]
MKDSADVKDSAEVKDRAAQLKSATVSIRVSTIAAVAAVVVLVVVAGAALTAWLSARGDLRDYQARAADEQHAEQVASDYAVGASNIDYRDADAWLARLKAGTSTQLAAKFEATAPKLQELLLPLQWTSTAAPIAATVTQESGGVYTVNVFVNVSSTNAQTSTGGQTTVTYTVTVDRNSDWKITDVGGFALPVK